jgi:hypothetical protein
LHFCHDLSGAGPGGQQNLAKKETMMVRAVLSLGVGLMLVAGTLIAQQAQPAANANFQRGQIVKVDPQTNQVWIRTGTGTAAREQAFNVAKTATFYGANTKALSAGLRSREFRPGANVMYRLGPGTTGIAEMRVGTVPPPGTPATTGGGR